MSVVAITAVFQARLPRNEKLVCLTLADHADPTGGNIWPSVRRVAHMSCLSERTVQRTLRGLVAHGLLAIVEESQQHRPRAYRFTEKVMGALGVNLSPMIDPDPRGDKSRGAKLSPLGSRGANGTVRGDKPASRGDKSPAPGVTTLSPEPTPRTVVELKSTATPPTPPMAGGSAPTQDDWNNVPAEPEPSHAKIVNTQRLQTLEAWAKATWGTAEALAHMYNQGTPDHVPGIESLSTRRRARVMALLRQFPDRHWWIDVFAAYGRSRFLSGRARPTPGHENFKPDFDWLMSNGRNHGTENVVKVHDGAYDD